jgi:hypothetical protein
MLALILNLLAGGCPAAIVWFVVAIIVDTVDAVFGRPRAHISIKVFEFVPPRTNLDTATAIMGKIFCIGIPAACEHPGPNTKLACFTLPVCWLKPGGALGRHIAPEAPATLMITGVQIAANHEPFVSAITSAPPSELSAGSIFGALNNCEPAKPGAGSKKNSLHIFFPSCKNMRQMLLIPLVGVNVQ